MGVAVDKKWFKTKKEATEEIKNLGLYPRDGYMESGDLEDVHWHKSSLRIYLLNGSFETKDVESNQTIIANPGDLIRIPSSTLHAARCPEPATYVVGFESEEAMNNFKPEDPANLITD